MYKNRQGNFVSDTHRECTNCGVIFERTCINTQCLSCNTRRVKAMTPEWKMHQRAKQRAKNAGREFDLKFSDITIPTHCPILGIPLQVHSGSSGGKANSPSLDRIDSQKGYTRDNIQVISHRANVMKADASVAELKVFAEWVLKNL